MIVDNAIVTLGLALLLAALAASCTRKAQKTQAPQSCKRAQRAQWPLQLFLQPTKQANASPTGQPLDTHVQLLEVSSIEALQQQDLSKLWSNKEEIFKDALLHTHEHTVFVGATKTLQMQLDPKATHLVVLALMRSVVGERFWSATPLPLRYASGICQEQASTLPDPCYFVLVDQHHITSGFEPPAGFDRRTVASRCPSLRLLHHDAFEAVP